MNAAELHAGRGLDALLAEKVMGFNAKETNPDNWKWWDPIELTYGRRKPIPGEFSTDHAAAMDVVVRMQKVGYSFRAWQPGLGMAEGLSGQYAVVSFECSSGPCADARDRHGAYDVKAASLPLAIARAALVAMRVADWEGA